LHHPGYRQKYADNLKRELRVSRGAVVWIPAEKSKGHRLRWRQIDRLAQEHGRRVDVGF
jgi:hypothetical protein